MKKKVLFVVHQLNIGGVQKSLISALNAVDYEKNDVTLYIRKDRTDLLKDVNPNVSKIIVNDDSTAYYRLPYVILLTLIAKLCFLFPALEKKVNSRIRDYIVSKKLQYEKKHYFSDGTVYYAAVSYIQGYPAELTADIINAKRKVMFFHGSEDEQHTLHKRIFGKFDCIYAVNDGCADVLKKLYPEYSEKISFIENYVDYKAVREKAVEFTPERAKLTLCTCGRIEEVKGFDLAVGAAEILKNAGLEFIWYFVGDGKKKDEIQKLIDKKNLGENIKITGMQNNPYPYINACDIYVQTSRAEAQGIVIVEAQILSKPVVSTLTVGGKSMVKDKENGLLAEFTHESIAEKIIELSDENLRAAFAEELKKIDFSLSERIYTESINKILD